MKTYSVPSALILVAWVVAIYISDMHANFVLSFTWIIWHDLYIALISIQNILIHNFFFYCMC